MKPDVAIEEIRAVRQRISEKYGHNTKALLDHYRQLEKKYQDRLIKDHPKPFPSSPGSNCKS